MVVQEKGSTSTFPFRDSRRIVMDDRDDNSTLSPVEDDQSDTESTLAARGGTEAVENPRSALPELDKRPSGVAEREL